MLVKIIKKIIYLSLLLLVVLIASFFAYQKGWIKNHPFANTKIDLKNIRIKKNDGEIKIEGIEINKTDLENIGTDGLSQIKYLSEKAASAGGVTQEFIQKVIKVDESKDKNLSEKAFDYGRYIYCQEVVKEYEVSF